MVPAPKNFVVSVGVAKISQIHAMTLTAALPTLSVQVAAEPGND